MFLVNDAMRGAEESRSEQVETSDRCDQTGMKGEIVGKLGRRNKRRNDDGLFQMFWRLRQIKDTGTVKTSAEGSR